MGCKGNKGQGGGKGQGEGTKGDRLFEFCIAPLHLLLASLGYLLHPIPRLPDTTFLNHSYSYLLIE